MPARAAMRAKNFIYMIEEMHCEFRVEFEVFKAPNRSPCRSLWCVYAVNWTCLDLVSFQNGCGIQKPAERSSFTGPRKAQKFLRSTVTSCLPGESKL